MEDKYLKAHEKYDINMLGSDNNIQKLLKFIRYRVADDDLSLQICEQLREKWNALEDHDNDEIINSFVGKWGKRAFNQIKQDYANLISNNFVQNHKQEIKELHLDTLRDAMMTDKYFEMPIKYCDVDIIFEGEGTCWAFQIMDGNDTQNITPAFLQELKNIGSMLKNNKYDIEILIPVKLGCKIHDLLIAQKFKYDDDNDVDYDLNIHTDYCLKCE